MKRIAWTMTAVLTAFTLACAPGEDAELDEMDDTEEMMGEEDEMGGMGEMAPDTMGMGMDTMGMDTMGMDTSAM